MPIELVIFLKQLLNTSKEQTSILQMQFNDNAYLVELAKMFNLTEDAVDL